MKNDNALDPSALLEDIAAARERFGNHSNARLELERLYDTTYWVDQEPEWMPRVAEIDATISATSPWIELELSLASGPAYLYRYFPFAAYIYVDGEAVAVVEFKAPGEEQRAVVAVPSGRRFRLTIVSELSAPPTDEEQRELAIACRNIALKRPTQAPSRIVQPSALSSYATHRTPLTEGSPAPIFVVGPYRSGTSILTWALGQHPDIWPLDETRWFQLLGSGALAAYALATDAPVHFFDVYDIARAEYMAALGSTIDRFVRAASSRRADEVTFKRLAGMADKYHPRFQLRRSALTPKNRWVDGKPENADCILLLNELFPAARFVCLLRRPKDVVASMLHFHRAGGSPMDVATAADMWLQKTRNCLLAYRALGPQCVHVLQYERVVDPAPVLRELFAFLGEPDFPAAAETFESRINTSSLASEERKSAHEEIDRSPTVAAAMDDLYARFIKEVSAPWRYDRTAHESLRDAQNEIVHRMVETVV